MTQPLDIKRNVREAYARIALNGGGCGAGCGDPATIAQAIGYGPEELASVPEGANLGLGCGSPLALAQVREGDAVLDLGSGAGFDCFLAAQAVGPTGRVIGVDMTPEMIERARRNAAAAGFGNVEFRPGEIEALPVEDASVDLVISNCVINLSPDKGRVFQEAYRVLRPGGRISVSDTVLLAELPQDVRRSVDAYTACVAGAVPLDEYLAHITAAGFVDVRVVERLRLPGGAPDDGLLTPERMIESVKVQAAKPD